MNERKRENMSVMKGYDRKRTLGRKRREIKEI